MDGPSKTKEISPDFDKNKVYDLPCGKTFDGNDLEPIHVDKLVGLSEYKGRSIVTLVVREISMATVFAVITIQILLIPAIVLPHLHCA